MPLSSKGNKIMRSMKKKYGSKKAKRVFYASRNKGTIKGVEESVFNTYRTLAYLLSEVRSAMEVEADTRAKVTKREEERPKKPMGSGEKMLKYMFPENFPPHTTDPDSPEQVGQEAGNIAGDLRHKRLKKIASQPVRVKVGRALKKGARRVERGIGQAVSKVMKGVKRDEKNQPVGINVEPRTARQFKELQSRKGDIEDSVFNTYRTMVYLLGEDARIHRGLKREEYHPSQVPEQVGMWLAAKHKLRGHDSGRAELSNREYADAHHQHETLTDMIGKRHGDKNIPGHIVSRETEMMAHHAGRDDIDWDYNTGRGTYREGVEESVFNTYRTMAYLLFEGISTGGDIEATAERLGSWYKGINPKAKPGQKGYMRKRNVPPLKDKHGEPTEYDPTKHEAPEEGKPLRYMKPQHKDYTRAFIRGKVLNISTRTAERDAPKGGEIHKIHKDKMALQAATLKKGRDILKKHGVPDPPQAEMTAKWIKGNNPYHPTQNPEGYIRSDRPKKSNE